jgi:PhzF family phenazine biosynthesis protein
MSRLLEVVLVDAFTTTALAGNPAAVVPDAGGLEEATMRAIAIELGRPATAFLGPAPAPGVDRALRWFSPTGVELSLCGHGTVAAGHVLAERGEIPGGRLVCATPTRRLTVTQEPPGAPEASIWFEPDCPRWMPALAADLEPVLEVLRLGRAALGSWAPPARTSEQDLLVPVAGLETLGGLAPDLGALGRAAQGRGLRGICLTAREAREQGALTHSRNFVPHLGIPEDPATGSAHAAIGVWLWETGGLTPVDGVARFRAEQGDFRGRPGRLGVEVHGSAGRATRVRVGGQAVTVLAGSLRVA